MRIDGKQIAQNILASLSFQHTPVLQVILVGDNHASLSFIKQKQKAAETIGAKVLVSHLPDGRQVSLQQLQDIIHQYNDDPSIHGIIIQRPVPMKNVGDILNSVAPQKDIDGFVPNSPFSVPVALAVEKILDSVSPDWKSKRIVIIGRGETAGKPINDHLLKLDCTTSVIHSLTRYPKEILRQADIIISCVGKERTVTKDDIKPGLILMSVGITRNAEGKLVGDYDEEEIKGIASFYTPTPGGVGPVNVACLMANLVAASK